MKELLDNRNIELWNKISTKYIIDFQKDDNIEYGYYSKDNLITFYIGKGELSKDSFTHEMLHVYFKLNNCFLGGGLSNILLHNNRLGKILTSKLIEHIANCFEHIKMLPMYLEMGFERSKFLTDYYEYKCKPNELKYLKNNYLIDGKINMNLVDSFIGKLVAMLTDPNDKFDYYEELKEFKNLDSLLFLALESAFNHWKTINIESDGVTEMNYHDLVFDLEYDLEQWYENNL